MIFIDDMDDRVVDLTNIIKFADDTKRLKIIKNDKDRVECNKHFNNLCEWAEKGGMRFNAESLK
jgi:hypothetical protein